MTKKFWAEIVPILASRLGLKIYCQSALAQMTISTLKYGLAQNVEYRTRKVEIQIRYSILDSRYGAMVARESLEQTATSIAALDRDELQRRIKNFRGRFRLDFTEDYLNSLSVDRLRHILLAALITAHVRA